MAVKVTALDGAAKPIGEPVTGRRLGGGREVALGAPATNWYLIEITR